MKQMLFPVKRDSTVKSLLILLILISSCVARKKQADTVPAKENVSKETTVLIKTTLGDVKVKLYNETPLHRDNFIRLVKSHSYDSTLFHRVIKSFMIQGGDPDSKKAAEGVQLGNGEMGSSVPAEFKPGLFHKKGALAAARQGDNVNPEKKSSSCQFYIVQGKVFNDADLDRLELRINSSGAYKFSPEQRQAYKTIGGTPHLDTGYTVFGEVVEGMDVVEKIAAVQVDRNDRPLVDVRVLKMEIVK
jgi:cyclophilin family peptidyl-prolyl cis-trans isomerase